MYENRTFEALLKEMIDDVPDDVDKREGSIIYNAMAPTAKKLAQAYADIDMNIRLSYAATASGEWLDMRTAEHGVERQRATNAKRKAVFFNSTNQPMDVPGGSRFSLENLDYVLSEKLGIGIYEVICEQTGEVGNQQFGTLIPIDFIPGLARAELTDVLVPGEDDESDESLYERYLAALNEQPFGGNVPDYKEKIGKITGVGAVKVFPVWQGGGTVKCTILASDFNPPDPILVDEVQTIMDPVENSGEGLGLAPIGHRVTIAAAQAVEANMSTVVTLQQGYAIEQVQPDIEQVFSDYLLLLRKNWKNDNNLIVRVSQIEARVLGVKGVTDIMITTINGTEGNLVLGAEQVPMDGEVILNVE